MKKFILYLLTLITVSSAPIVTDRIADLPQIDYETFDADVDAFEAEVSTRFTEMTGQDSAAMDALFAEMTRTMDTLSGDEWWDNLVDWDAFDAALAGSPEPCNY